jgi:hypothetical protein
MNLKNIYEVHVKFNVTEHYIIDISRFAKYFAIKYPEVVKHNIFPKKLTGKIVAITILS